jgi:hypothetical protein
VKGHREIKLEKTKWARFQHKKKLKKKRAEEKNCISCLKEKSSKRLDYTTELEKKREVGLVCIT